MLRARMGKLQKPIIEHNNMEPITLPEVQVDMRNLEIRKAPRIDNITKKIIINGGTDVEQV